MGAIHYEVIQQDGSFIRYNSLEELKDLEDFLFIVKKEEGYHCATYSHYSAQIIDKEGTCAKADYKGYVFSVFKIIGQAADYILSVRFDRPANQGSTLREFHQDISYNHTYEGYSTLKPEWDLETQYKNIFAYLDELDKYGLETYNRILELEREAYKQNALYRREKYDYMRYQKHVNCIMTYVKELYIPDSVTSIYDNIEPYLYESIERVYLPKSLEYIDHFPFSGGDGLKQVFCLAEKPPRIRFAIPHISADIALYVPKTSLEAYQNDESWSKCFLIIKGI